MCCRYFVEEEQMEAAERSAWRVDPSVRSCRTGDIRPADPAPVLRQEPGGLCLTALRWGWPAAGQNRLLINARAETVRQKPLFSGRFESGRIVLPAAGFYEWTAGREKHTFRGLSAPVLYLAGISDRFDTEGRFLILTTQAGPDVRPVHARMPLLLEPEQAADWLASDRRAEQLLNQPPPRLQDLTEYRQISFF